MVWLRVKGAQVTSFEDGATTYIATDRETDLSEKAVEQ
jgi:hypothetical protein